LLTVQSGFRGAMNPTFQRLLIRMHNL